MISWDLDFWLNSTRFWWKNHFCSLKTKGVTNIFWQIFFSITLFSVKMSPTVKCSSRRLLHNVVCFPFQTWLTFLVRRWRGGASVDTSTCFHSPFLLLRTPHCSNITARRIQVLPHKGMPLTAASTFTTQHNYPQKWRPFTPHQCQPEA